MLGSQVSAPRCPTPPRNYSEGICSEWLWPDCVSSRRVCLVEWGEGSGCYFLSSLLRVLWWRHWGDWYKEVGWYPGPIGTSPFNLIFPTFSRWTAEDVAFIRIPINLFLDQLPLVIQNIRSLGIPPFLGWGKRVKPNLVSPTRQCIEHSNLRVITTLLFECKFLPLLAFGISWFTCFVSLLREEWDASVFHSRK